MATGKGGVKLYFNGVLVGTSDYQGSFATIGNGDHNYLGRNSWKASLPELGDLQGQIAEVRVWKLARNEEQIRATMFQHLSGREEGLGGLWNFADGTVRDATPNGYHGRLIGNARVVSAPLPVPAEVSRPAVLFGIVKDSLGTPKGNATLHFWRKEAEVATITSRADGSYAIALLVDDDTIDIGASAGELGAWKIGAVCSKSQRMEINLSLTTEVSVVGRVMAFDGSLIPDVMVQVGQRGFRVLLAPIPNVQLCGEEVTSAWLCQV